MTTTGSAPAPPAPEHRPARPAGGRRSGLVALAVLALVALVALVLWAVTRPAPRYDPDTPQGTVQGYVTAVLDGDAAAAAAVLADGSPCTVTDLDRAYVARGTTVDLVGTDVTGDRALVRVRVGVDTGTDPLGGWTEDHAFRLTRTAAGWRIDGVPWPLYDCTGG